MGHSDLTMLQKHDWKWRPGAIPRPAIDALNEVLSVRQLSDTRGGINAAGKGVTRGKSESSYRYNESQFHRKDRVGHEMSHACFA
jgi:hypothetical protein